MRSIILSCVSFFLACASFAQTFTLTPKTAVGGSANSSTVDVHSIIKNNSTSDDDSLFKWTLVKRTGAAFESSFCDPYSCYPSPPVGATNDFKLKKGMSGEFKVTFLFNNTSGWDTMKVYVFSANSPSNSDTLTFIANGWLTGVKEVNRSADISFYPNPVKDQLNFRFPSSTPVNVEVYSILGVKVKSFLHEGSSTQINVSDLKNGVYFLRVKDGGRMYSKSFNKAE